MKIGINTFVTDEGIGPAALGRAVEERGFDSLFLAEHSHVPASRATPYPGGGEMPRVYYRAVDPLVALAAAAAVTDTLLLGTSVTLLIQRDVIYTAKEVATLDLISGGRVIFGVGVGWNREEMADHGTDPRTRGALLNEQLRAIKEIWTNDLAEFHGEFIDFGPMYSWPKPVRKPHPPIYIGGSSVAAVRRVAEHGDGWLPNCVPDAAGVKAQLDLLAEHAGAGVPVTVSPVARDYALLEAYAEAGVERVTFFLPTRQEDGTLAYLDELAQFSARYR